MRLGGDIQCNKQTSIANRYFKFSDEICFTAKNIKNYLFTMFTDEICIYIVIILLKIIEGPRLSNTGKISSKI